MEKKEFKLEYSTELQDRLKNFGINMTEDKFNSFLSLIDGIDMKDATFHKHKCYLWKGPSSKKKKGSNHAHVKGFGEKGHRLMGIMVYDIPKDLVKPKQPCPCGETNKFGKVKTYMKCCRTLVRHVCKEINGEDHDGLCLNPLHLRLGTTEENQHDIRVHNTGRGGVFLGEKSYQAKMTDVKAAQVWEEIKLKNHKELKEIAKKFEISYSCVKVMSCGKSWNHITKLPKYSNEKRKQRDELKYQKKMQTKKNAHDIHPNKVQKLTFE